MKRILVIDDDRFMRHLLSRALEEEGRACDTATCPDEARERLNQRAFDLVVTDVDMPGGSGLDLAAEILSRDPAAAVMTMTASEDPRRGDRARDLGVREHLIKPFPLDRLRQCVSSVLEGRDTRSLDTLRAAHPVLVGAAA